MPDSDQRQERTPTRWYGITDAEVLLQRVRSEALALLQEHNTNIYGMDPESLKYPYGWVSPQESLNLVKEKDFRYESRYGTEVAQVELLDTDRGPINVTIFKLADMLVEINELDRKIRFTTKGITFEININEKFYKRPVTYIDESGVERTVIIEDHGLLNALTSPYVYYNTGYGEAILINDTTTEIRECQAKGEISFNPVKEKFPDGTTREFDDKGRVTSEQLPDGTITTWEYDLTIEKMLNRSLFSNTQMDGRYTLDGACDRDASHGLWDTLCDNIGNIYLKKVTRGNETAFYICDVYVGKMVKHGKGATPHRKTDASQHIDNLTQCYDAQGRLVEEIIGYMYTYPGNEYVEENSEYYERMNTYFANGNIKMTKMLGAPDGLKVGDSIYYDPDTDGKEIARTEYNGSLMYAADKPEARAAMKQRFLMAMEKGDIQEAKLALGMILNSFTPFNNPQFVVTDYSLLVRNDVIKFDIKVLDDGKILIGAIYEDRHWAGESFRGGGIEWYWKAAAVVIDLEGEGCGLVASCQTSRINVRHSSDPNQDLWNKLDDRFMTINPQTGELTIGFRVWGTWKESATLDLRAKIAEYDEFAASSKAEMQESGKTTADRVRQYKEATEQQIAEHIIPDSSIADQLESNGSEHNR